LHPKKVPRQRVLGLKLWNLSRTICCGTFLGCKDAVAEALGPVTLLGSLVDHDRQGRDHWLPGV